MRTARCARNLVANQEKELLAAKMEKSEFSGNKFTIEHGIERSKRRLQQIVSFAEKVSKSMPKNIAEASDYNTKS